MRGILLVAVTAVLSTACGRVGQAPAGPAGNDAEPASAPIYAEVIRRLVTVDHTFGSGASPFEYVYVVDGVVAGREMPVERTADEPFAEDLKRAIARRLEELPPLEFVRDPDAVRVGEMGLDGVENNGVIISLGPVEPAGDRVHVATGLWCGGVCGQWLTYVLVQSEEGWRITGTTGPVAIS